MIDIELQRTRSAMAESVTLPIAMWLEALDELEALRQTRLVQQAEKEPVCSVCCKYHDKENPVGYFLPPANELDSWEQVAACDNQDAVPLYAAPVKQAEQEPVAWWEFNGDIGAWFLAYTFNPKAKTRPLVFGDTAIKTVKEQK